MGVHHERPIHHEPRYSMSLQVFYIRSATAHRVLEQMHELMKTGSPDAVFVDACVSGRSVERPGWQALLRYCATAGRGVVRVSDFARSGRGDPLLIYDTRNELAKIGWTIQAL